MRQMAMAGFLLLAAVSAGCGPADQERLDANKNLVRRFGATIDAADWDGLDASVTKDLHRHGPTTSNRREITSREEFKRLEQTYHTSFPDMRVTYEMMVAEGDMVAAYATFTGTNTGSLGDTPATGRSGQMTFLAMFRIEEGKIAEIWVESDRVSLLTQLGLFPPAGSKDGK